MRALTRILVSATTAVGIAAGSLALAATSAAASETPTKQVVSAEAYAPLATQNFGLSEDEAKGLQGWLKRVWGYEGEIDGKLGTNSWKAMQRLLKEHHGYNDAIDGIPGTNTVKALQRLLRHYDYTGDIDGIAGPETRAAFKRFANVF
ncbi:peptidoglycan-binding domain-containing protein [Streptomyces sp. NPDC000851]